LTLPIFEFTCRACGARFEEIMTFAEMEAGKAACSACGSPKVERDLSTFATGSGSVTSSSSSLPCGGGGCGGGGAFT
jgi:putative FmdB family regulatory protein